MHIYDFNLRGSMGEEISLKNFKDKVLLVVNVPLNTGSTLQHKKLEELYKNYKEQGLEILAVQTDEFSIKLFGEAHLYSFPLTEKMKVRGENQHQLYTHLTSEAPDSLGTFYSQAKRAFVMRGLDVGKDNDVMWNFEKFLIGKSGNIVKRFAPEIHPDDSRLLEELEKEITHGAKRSA